MTRASLNTAFGPASAIQMSGSLNDIPESSDAKTFGQICQGFVGEQGPNRVVASSSPSDADLTSGTTSAKSPVVQPSTKEKDLNVSGSLLSLGAMLAAPTLVDFNQPASTETVSCAAVHASQAISPDTPETQAQDSIQNSAPITDAEVRSLSSISSNPDRSSPVDAALDASRASLLVRDRSTSAEATSENELNPRETNTSLGRDASENTPPPTQGSDILPVVWGGAPLDARLQGSLGNDFVPTPLLKSDRTPSNVHSSTQSAIDAQNAVGQVAQTENSIQAIARPVQEPGVPQTQTLDRGAEISSSTRLEIPTTSKPPVSSPSHPLRGMQRLAGVGSSLSVDVESQAPAGPPPRRAQMSTDSQISAAASSIIQAAVHVDNSINPAEPQSCSGDLSAREPNRVEGIEGAASQRALASAQATAPDSPSTPGNKSLYVDAPNNSRHSDHESDVDSSIASLSPSLIHATNASSIASCTATPNEDGSKSASSGNSAPADSASSRRPDLSASTATTAGPVQLAQILNRAEHAEMRIGLNTTAFGDVEIRTVVHATDVGVQIGSEKGNLQALLINDLPSISGHLQQQNLHLTQVSFHSSGLGSGGGSSQGDASYSRPANSHSHRDLNLELPEDEVTEAPAIRGSAGLSVLA